ncbi:MAG: hypothetical protein JNL32_00030 [Candidatus Kapabacteria bacterium]|nr:hypothetical protein [Candidatus Kapabacteria bacterium]
MQQQHTAQHQSGIHSILHWQKSTPDEDEQNNKMITAFTQGVELGRIDAVNKFLTEEENEPLIEEKISLYTANKINRNLGVITTLLENVFNRVISKTGLKPNKLAIKVVHSNSYEAVFGFSAGDIASGRVREVYRIASEMMPPDRKWYCMVRCIEVSTEEDIHHLMYDGFLLNYVNL